MALSVLDHLVAKDFLTVIPDIKKGFPVSVVEELKDEIGVAKGQLADVTHIPTRTLHRREKTGRLDPMESERLYRLAKLFHRAVELWGGDHQKARDWFKRANIALNGQSPLQFADTEVGARYVEDLIGRLEHGVLA